jgi:multicomponent Na+:H+ antiporter subunit E
MRAPDAQRFHLAPVLRAAGYFPWLLKEIAAANWTVIRIVLSPRLNVDPVVLTVKASQHSDLGRVVYGNSITLTPGTLTVDVDGDQLTVHALTRAGAEQLEAGEMDLRVSRLEGQG